MTNLTRPDLIRLIIFFASLIYTAYSDLKYRKVPGSLTQGVTCFALILGTLENGLWGLGVSLMGWLIGFFPLYLVYRKNGMGAGDVKLMGMVGALGGPKLIILSYWYTSILGFIMALYTLWNTGQMKKGLKKSFSLFKEITGLQTISSSNKDDACSPEIPYSIAIVLGSYIAFFSITNWNY